MNSLKNGDISELVRESLGLDPDVKQILNEAYVAQIKEFDLPTELLSAKNKKAHRDLYEKYVKDLNRISAELDAVDREAANLNHSQYRSLKIDEVYNLNAVHLHELFFANISDVRSQVNMDSLAFMRLERDFGTFDRWQKDFIACALSARNGWVVTGFSTFLQTYVSCIVDLHNSNLPAGFYPVIVLDCWEHSYYRDYINNRKTYIYAMMKELDWGVIEERFKRADKIAKALK